MSWLIALGLLSGLFWLLLPLLISLAKAADKAEQNKATRIKAIKGNVYTIAWDHLEDMQREFLDANQDLPNKRSIITYYNFHHERSMEEESVIYAINDLRSRHQPVFVMRGSCPVIIPPHMLFTPDEYVDGILRDMPPLYGPFKILYACKVSDEKAQEIFMSIWDKKRPGDNRLT